MEENFVKYNIEFKRYLTREATAVIQNLLKKVHPRSELGDYKMLRSIGAGSTGHVVYAENLVTGKPVAIKIIKKEILKNADRLTHLKREIHILSAVNFEFMISLDCYFTNNCYVFMVLPYVGGGSFFKLLREVQRFEELPAMFFAGQVVSAIEYLHFMGIIYRDLKPENLVLDIEGYLKLVDFGFAKRVGRSFTYTFCGTPEYIAPEILAHKGYNQSPDWWTFGVLLFEMCSGSPPFTSRNDFTLYEKILKGHIVWPKYFSPSIRSLIHGLLQVDKTKRLGCMKNGSEDVKKHKWFATLNWSALWHKKISPPYIPGKTFQFGDASNILPELKSSVDCTFSTNDNIRNIDFEIY